MKIRTNIDLSDVSKASMIARRIPIPKSFMTFEMSPEKAHIFANKYAIKKKLIVSEEEIYVEEFRIDSPMTKYVQGGLDSRDGMITSWTKNIGKSISLENILIPDIIIGTLIEGMNIDAYIEKVEANIVTNRTLLEVVTKEIQDFDAHAPQRAMAKQIYDSEQEKLRVEKETKEAEERTIQEAVKAKEKEAIEEAKKKRIAWAQDHGSDRLLKGLLHGHTCKKLYETELGESLIANSDYEYDQENKVEEKGRSCPSLAALEEVERIEKTEGLSASAVWLPEGLTELHKDPEEYNEPESGCEAVKIDVKGTAGYWYKTF